MRAGDAARLALRVLPLAIVAQDAPSRILQGHTLSSHPWEVATFGDHALARADLGMPGWYVLAAAITLGLLVAYLRRAPSPPDTLTGGAPEPSA